jgi:Protein of unknown function (DUF2924)
MRDSTEMMHEAPAHRGRRGGVATAAHLNARLAALPGLSHEELRLEWRRLHRSEPPKRISREILELGIAWKLQEKALGGISTAVKRRLAELAETVDRTGDLTRSRTRTLKPGAKLVREWQGECHDVLVLDDGFAWRGQTWRSLSAIAQEITGTHWSGPRFFGLGNPERSRGSSGTALRRSVFGEEVADAQANA